MRTISLTLVLLLIFSSFSWSAVPANNKKVRDLPTATDYNNKWVHIQGNTTDEKVPATKLSPTAGAIQSTPIDAVGATTVQGAIDELATEKSEKGHGHVTGDIDGLEAMIWDKGLPRYLTDPAPLSNYTGKCWVKIGSGLSCTHDGVNVVRYTGTTEPPVSNVATASIQGISLAAFPKAEGVARSTTAGRGGVVIRVNTLSDNSNALVNNADGTKSGSLRSALAYNGTRTIVFEVGGTITTTGLTVGYGNVSIYGQTAPSPGITLRCTGATGLGLSGASNVVIQHLRIRGDGADDVFQITGGSFIIADHISVSWADADENMSISSSSAHTITLSHVLCYESLNFRELLIAYNKSNAEDNIFVVKSLFGSTDSRHPRVHSGADLAYINNYMYNISGGAADVGDADDVSGNGHVDLTWVGNVTAAGPNTNTSKPQVQLSGGSGHQIYANDNINKYGGGDIVGPGLTVVGTPPVTYSTVSVLAASTTKAYTVANSGARPKDRDSNDNRFLTCANNESGCSWVEAIPGGFPSLTSSSRKVVIPSNPSADDDGDGWTNLEEYIYNYTKNVEEGIALPF